ncbi:transient receptor potential channel pyrexia-like [Bacillus rossius redtenbacheri]|uniref:transient receptor potential channel pyrexia-like n=1 Tax=Bacillus rossius redtenbacheri TaxID=93214 RepID=UPI002FDCAF33
MLGRSALHLAAASGAAGCADLLLRRGASVRAWDHQHLATPLHCAASAGSLACVRLLLGAGAEVDAGITCRSPLHYAVQSEATDCMRELLRAGASPNTPQVYTETPLHVAAARGSAASVQLLLEHGADVRVQMGPSKTTALHLAAEDESAECARLLLDAGADVDAPNSRLQTPLHLAALAQAGETLDLLLRRGADPSALDVDGRTPLHGAIVKTCRSCECVRALLEAGAAVNQADSFGYSPLHIAALNELSACVWLLLRHGADMTARTHGGVSALTFIVRRTPAVLPRILSQLDAAVKLHEHEIGDVDCELKLDLRVLVPSVERGESGLLLAFIEVGQRHILQHPLCETFLFLKWRRIRKFFLFSLVFHSVFALLFSIYIWLMYLNNCSEDVGNSSGCQIPKYLDVIGYIVIAFNMLFLGKEVFQIAHSWTSYINHWENWLQWLIIACVFPCVVHVHRGGSVKQDVQDWQHHVAAVAIFFTWVELMMIVGRFPMFGLYVQMFTIVAINFAKFLLTYTCLFLAFSLSFGVLFSNYPAFQNLGWCLIKTLVMMSGELEFEDIFYNNVEQYPVQYPFTSHVLFAAFVILVTVILTNLLVGLAVSDIQGLQQSAGLDRLVRQAQLVAHLESMLFSRLLRCLPAKLLTLCHRSALLLTSPYQSSLYIRPNDPRERRVPRDIVGSAYRLVAERRKHRRDHRSPSAGDYSYVKLTHPSVANDCYLYVPRAREAEAAWAQVQSQLDTVAAEARQQYSHIHQSLLKLQQQLEAAHIQPAVPSTHS